MEKHMMQQVGPSHRCPVRFADHTAYRSCALTCIKPRGYQKTYPARTSRWSMCGATADIGIESAASVDLPADLQNPVAILEAKNPDAPGGVTKCFVLAISHVSQYSCDQIEELINSTSPEIVMVELCKDRVSLLIDRNTQGTQTWHARKVFMTGATMSEEWPSEQEILALCKAQKGHPLQVQDIEDDVFTLLGTGLFSRGRPMFGRAEDQEAPAFMPRLSGGELLVQSVPPLGSIEFQMRDRNLPPIIEIELRVDSSLEALGITEEEAQALCSEALQSSKDGTRSLTVYLKLRKKLIDMCGERGRDDAVVIFRGEERGRPEIVVRARKPSDPSLITGFEEGAEGGVGWGIDTFRPAKRPYQLSEQMSIPQPALDKIIGNERLSNVKAESSVEVLKEKLAIVVNEYRMWKENENPITYQEEGKGPADYFGGVITSLYGKFQGEAGRKVGVDAGAAWRTAMNTAVKKGIRQLHLGDMPTSVSSRHLAQSIFVGMGTRFLIALALSLSVAATFTVGILPDVEGLAKNATYATALLDIAILWPVFVPYVEIYRLSAMSRDGIEDAVKVKVPVSENLDQVLKLFGEDALLDWPGAMVPIIDERDKYMARNLHAAATGTTGASPAFIQDIVDGKVVLRYMMPENGPRRSAPMGQGDGEYQPVKGVKSVVAVVGSAHVRGMIKEWERLEQLGNVGVDEFLY